MKQMRTMEKSDEADRIFRLNESQQATPWTRLSRHRFRANEMYLELSVLADTLGNLRRLRLPHRIKSWALTSLPQRLVKTGDRFVKHASSDSGPDSPQRRQSERSVASESVEVFWAPMTPTSGGRLVAALWTPVRMASG